jgi:hypothetical protein
MIQPHEELENLRIALLSRQWQPSGAEREVARIVLRTEHLTASALRTALPGTDQPLFAALGRVASELALPPAREGPGGRQHLVTALRNLLQAVARARPSDIRG